MREQPRTRWLDGWMRMSMSMEGQKIVRVSATEAEIYVYANENGTSIGDGLGREGP